MNGELDIRGRWTVERLVAPFIARGEPLLLDLAAVTFADSSTVRLLQDLHGEAHTRGWEFAVTGLSDAARRVLEVSGACDEIPRYAA